MLRLHNTLTGKKEDFVPIKAGAVGMYHCGPTVYDYVHIGNLRAFVTADLLRRTFEFNDFKVNQVINITDVGIGGDNDEGEDKMTKGLQREKKPITLEAMKELGDFYADRFKEQLLLLNIKTPTSLPKASEHIAEDIELIKILEEKGFAYRTNSGIYFDTSKDPNYGKLGGISKDENEDVARIAKNTNKKNLRDFALWKFNATLGFASPWGQGFPGWHIECSAMSKKYLGEHFDIHTGGMDLAPIHHNNEIAQSENACDCGFVNVWVHNAFVNVKSGKMAKSEGNSIRLQTLMDKKIPPLAYRYWLLGAIYRTPMTFSWETLEAARTAFEKLGAHIFSLGNTIGEVNKNYLEKFTESVNNDLNTPQGLALLWDLLKDESVSLADKKATALEFDKVLGLGLDKLDTDQEAKQREIPRNIFDLANLREIARKNKDWQRSDELRDEISKLGYQIKDTDQGPVITW